VFPTASEPTQERRWQVTEYLYSGGIDEVGVVCRGIYEVKYYKIEADGK
jgi:hypothetical protein